MQSILAKCVGVIILTICAGISWAETTANQAVNESFYSREIQKIFDNRCVACHSCFNAPCQLNLQNHEGFSRGATKLNVYNGLRTQSVLPTRLWVDAHTTREWRDKGFFDINTSKKPEENILFSLLKLRQQNPNKFISKQVAASMVCPDSMAVIERAKETPELGMPYGLPPLSETHMASLKKWISAGAPTPESSAEIPVKSQKQVKTWEKFLNGSKPQERLVARYIFEHLFLAHIYFPEDKKTFFKLIRSQDACHKPREIATRRPNDDPGTKNFFYCVIPFAGTPVLKTHIPYEWSAKKLSRYREIFFETKWQTKALPTYERTVAENPFVAFRDIPVRARYKFLLEDAHYQVSTFIKGPVCNGSNAVNSIQEQFFVYFVDPDSDNSVLSEKYADHIAPLLMLPGVFGSDVEIKETPLFYKKLVDHREAYRKIRIEGLRKLRPQGYVLSDIWNGDDKNPNAALTIFRHDDNAVVTQGAVGDLPKTVFMLDYPLFERLVYNLVVNFDVFGNISHQFLTRVYMDMIRMEAEEIFLMFLPPEQRLALRRAWYRGLLTEAKMTYAFPTVGSAEPTGVRFRDEDKDTKKQMVEKILFYRFKENVRGRLDALNWKNIELPETMQGDLKIDETQKKLKEVASVVAVNATPFARYFPDLAYVKIHDEGTGLRVFSLIHNKEHESISWIMAESLRMAPKEDTLTFAEGYFGSYPNMIFDVKAQELTGFVEQIKKIKSEADYESLVTRYGIRRSNSQFWDHYDELTTFQRKTVDQDFGYLDLTRYSLK